MSINLIQFFVATNISDEMHMPSISKINVASTGNVKIKFINLY